MSKFIHKKRNLLDAKDVSWLEILQHSFVNFLFGVTGGISIAFLALFVIALQSNKDVFLNLVMFFICYFIHNQVESKILNRNRYITKLGRNLIFPFPKTIGFVLGAYISTLI
jgi:hypothetical protein|tara:strand:- start:4132 stop:4467 length:336 start_codon:yes stop_codon:yes gene_type:complete